MSTELINRVTVKWDGVYLSSHSSNDTAPFHSWHCNSLTDIYMKEGQRGLDREMLRMFYEYAKPCGSHPSVERYRTVMNGEKGKALYAEYLAEINFWYEQLTPEDRDTVYYKPTSKAREYLDFVQHKRDELYTKIAGLCSPVERNPMQNHHESQEEETKKYRVKITEYLESIVEIEAKSPEEAEKIADENYSNGDHFLDPETYIGAEFHAEAVEKTRDVSDDRGR